MSFQQQTTTKNSFRYDIVRSKWNIHLVAPLNQLTCTQDPNWNCSENAPSIDPGSYRDSQTSKGPWRPLSHIFLRSLAWAILLGGRIIMSPPRSLHPPITQEGRWPPTNLQSEWVAQRRVRTGKEPRTRSKTPSGIRTCQEVTFSHMATGILFHGHRTKAATKPIAIHQHLRKWPAGPESGGGYVQEKA